MSYNQQPVYGNVVGQYPPQQQGYYGAAPTQQQQQQQQYYQQQQQQYYQQQQQQKQQAYAPVQKQPYQQQQQQHGAYSPAPTPMAYEGTDPSHGNYQQEFIGAVPSHHQPFMAQGVPLYADYCSGGASQPALGGGGGGGGGASKFVVQGWQDVWAAVLFILLTLAVIGVGSYNFHNRFGIERNTSLDPDTVYWGDFKPATYIMWGGIGVGAGLVLGVFSLAIFYLAPSVSIVGSNVLIAGIFFGMGGAFAYFFSEFYSCVIMCLVGVFRLVILYAYRRFIPMSGLFLKQSAILSKRHPAAIVGAFLTLLLAAVWCCFAFAMAYPTVKQAWESDNDSDSTNNKNEHHWGGVVAMFFFLAFCCFWAAQVAFNVGHTTFCGLTATWYFCGQETMPSNPTLHSGKRALTTSFGSICLGSLLVAVLRTLRYILRSMSRGHNNFCSCIALCCLGCIESLVRLFNHYSFVYVSMYGCSFVEGAKKTMALIGESRYGPIFNNLLIDGTLMMFQLVLSVAVAIVAYFVTRHQQLEDSANNGRRDDFWVGYSITFAAIAGCACIVTMAQMFRVVDSVVTTLLVCLTEEPQLIFTTNPPFAGELAEKAHFFLLDAANANRP